MQVGAITDEIYAKQDTSSLFCFSGLDRPALLGRCLVLGE